jgi:hypothetical protein
LVALWVGGDLAPRAAARVKAHVRECEACHLLSERLRATRVALATLAEEESDSAALQGLRQRVMVGLDHAHGGAASRCATRQHARISWKPALGAALFVASATGVVLVWRTAHGPEIPSVAAARPTVRMPEAIATPAPFAQQEAQGRVARLRPVSSPSAGRPQPRLESHHVAFRAREAAAESFVIKIVSDDPDVAIYWVVDGKKG